MTLKDDPSRVNQETVIVVDFGAQYAQLIARRVREANVYSEIVSPTIGAAEIAALQPIGIIFSGGPASVYAEDAILIDPEIYVLGVPILGICYGAQMIAAQNGGQVHRSGLAEYGNTTITLCGGGADDGGSGGDCGGGGGEGGDGGTGGGWAGGDGDGGGLAGGGADNGVGGGGEGGDGGTGGGGGGGGGGGCLLEGTPKTQQVWMSHADSIVAPPRGAQVTASTSQVPVAAFEDQERQIFGVQFHPEVIHTPSGKHVISQFLHSVCGAQGNWTMESIINRSVAEIRQQVGNEAAICGLSGGVDSAVAAALAHRAIGDQLTCVFVDTGLLRLNEASQVVEAFERNFGVRLVHVDAGERFFAALAGITDPEAKRKAIGELFIRVFEDAQAEAGSAKFLVQGTLYPDVIESGGKHASTIKSHHNVGGLPSDLEFELVEPLRNLFKDEVREVGKRLGLSDEIVNRQPFPGPGLGVRIVGEVTPEKVATLQKADFIVRDELRKAGLEKSIWQAFAVLPSIRTVGVMGDERSYGHPIIIRAVTSEDAMTADWARIPHEVLAKMSNRIINEVPEVNRVAYDITSKPPATIEWE